MYVISHTSLKINFSVVESNFSVFKSFWYKSGSCIKGQKGK